MKKIGKLEIDEWYLDKTSLLKDIWKRRDIDDMDSFIILERIRTSTSDQFIYEIRFTGTANFLELYLKQYNNLQFDNVQAAKDYVDKFLDRIGLLTAFL